MFRGIFKKSLTGIAAGTLCLGALSAQAITPFETDVNDAIDAGLQYARANRPFHRSTRRGTAFRCSPCFRRRPSRRDTTD